MVREFFGQIKNFDADAKKKKKKSGSQRLASTEPIPEGRVPNARHPLPVDLFLLPLKSPIHSLLDHDPPTFFFFFLLAFFCIFSFPTTFL